MSEKRPSGSDGQDPWRRPNNSGNSGPPDLMKLMQQFFKKFANSSSSSNQPGKTDNSVGLIVAFIIGIIVILWALAGIYIVGPAEQAVVLRFGKAVATVGPGPHWIPRFIETQYKVDVQRIDSFPYESEMLTKDENIVSVTLQVQYRVDNPEEFLFNVVSPVTTLQQAVSSALRQVVGRMDLDPILTTGREYLSNQVSKQVGKTLKVYQTGIEVVAVALQAARPPTPVTPAFDDVLKAREDRQSYINQANAYAKKRVFQAEGVSARLLQEANAYAYTVVAKAKGATARYLALLKPYQQNADVTRERLYLDTLANVLSKTSNIVVDNSKGNNVMYLPLDRILKNTQVQTLPPSSKQQEVLQGGEQQNRDEQEDDSSGLNESIRVPTANNKIASDGYYSQRPSYSNGGQS